MHLNERLLFSLKKNTSINRLPRNVKTGILIWIEQHRNDRPMVILYVSGENSDLFLSAQYCLLLIHEGNIFLLVQYCLFTWEKIGRTQEKIFSKEIYIYMSHIIGDIIAPLLKNEKLYLYKTVLQKMETSYQDSL